MTKKQKHFPYHLHASRALFAALSLLAVGILHMPSLSPVQRVASSAPQTLAYATNISRSDLVAYTNSARAANGMGAFTENGQLNVAAQLKANDMIANNYWSHISPTGVQPWYWITTAGYDYSSAGENLAYGFSTSDATVTAWMNSPGHRANILGAFQDVGHGIANGENYQGNQNTVVVAHYAKPRIPAPIAAPVSPPAAPTTPSQPVASQSVAFAAPPTQQSETPPVATETPPAATTSSPSNAEKKEPTNNTTAPSANTSSAPVSTAPTSSTAPVWQQLLSGQAPLLVVISVSILVIAGIGYAATHLSLARRTVIMGEQYVLHHPMVDASFVIAASAIVLLSTVGRIG